MLPSSSPGDLHALGFWAQPGGRGCPGSVLHVNDFILVGRRSQGAISLLCVQTSDLLLSLFSGFMELLTALDKHVM